MRFVQPYMFCVTPTMWVLALLISLSASVHSIGKAHFVALNVLNVDATLLGVAPGDTVYLESGKRTRFKISNIKGDSLHYVVVTNKGGDVIIENSEHHFGVVFSNCSYFRFTGSVDNSANYGMRILKTGPGASGLSLGELCTNYEVDHVEISNTGFAGIFAFTHPTCDMLSNRGYFEQRNTIIRDNYIHDTYGEGMYLGHSFYAGYTQSCDGVDVTLFPHEIKNLKVYNNKIVNAGYDGIQVSSAVKGTEVYNNTILNYGTAHEEMQHSGIQIGAGTELRCYNNTIINGSGTGIMMMGVGGSTIFNNVIVNAGLDFYPNNEALRIYGIFVDDRFVVPQTSINILNNTIINTKSDGIRFFSTATVNNIIANNLIVNPGSTYLYLPDITSYINIKAGVNAQLLNNYYTKYIQSEFKSDSLLSVYSRIASLPLAARGLDVRKYGVEKDIFDTIRHVTPSIGAFEFEPQENLYSVKKNEIELSHNTKTDIILIENKSINSIRALNIFSLNGTKVFGIKVDEPRFLTVNLKGVLKQGLYVLSVERFNSVFTYKFVITAV
ncbi:MAG: right-handed parallel beta-helix repeat-containing protein [Paludibacter sp.]|nr:right-handed parallel beta-helix repeat-containing protein [Paludibacter sp.]